MAAARHLDPNRILVASKPRPSPTLDCIAGPAGDTLSEARSTLFGSIARKHATVLCRVSKTLFLGRGWYSRLTQEK